MRYRAVIVEDEEHSRRRLLRLLGDFPGDIEIVGEADNGLTAVDVIRATSPDLLFLDINLPGLDGFQLLGNLERQPAVIFTTASNQHALDAFKAYAVDYLLKPIDGDALGRAVEKLRTMGFNHGSFAKSFAQMAVHLGAPYLIRIICKVGDRLIIVKTSEVHYFQADNKYTSVYTSGKKYVIDSPLVELEQKLDPKDFIRIHRSTIVNVPWIAEIRKGLEGRMKVVILDPRGTELPVSRMYADNLKPH